MSRSINRVTLVGTCGRDPDVQTTARGEKVAHLSLATRRRIERPDMDCEHQPGYEERTEWHRLAVWGALAELAEEYIRKGDRLYVEGRIEYGSFERNGITVPTAEVVVSDLVLHGHFYDEPAREL